MEKIIHQCILALICFIFKAEEHHGLPHPSVAPRSDAHRAKSLQILVHGELIKQAISFMIAHNGLEKNGAREGRRSCGEKMTAEAERRWKRKEQKVGRKEMKGG